MRFGLVGNYQAGKSTLINCIIGRPIATIGDGTSTTHTVVNYLYGTKESIEYIDNNCNHGILDNTDLGRIDSTNNLKELNVYLNIPFLKDIILTDMPGFGKCHHDNMLSEKTLNEIDFAIVVETNYKAIEENSDSYKNIERLKWHNVPYYVILNCADISKKDWKWTPLSKNNLEIASKNIQQLSFYKPLNYPFKEGEYLVVNLLWYWYSISDEDDDTIIRYQENLKYYNDLTKYDKKDIYKFSNFEVVKKIFSMENRVYLELRKDLKQEIQRLKEELCPIGTIQTFAFENIPQGWLICDGRSYKIDEYPELYNAIGFTFGGKGAEFNVPDLRNQFVRGWDSRNRKLGSCQKDALQDHKHKIISSQLEMSTEGRHAHQTTYRTYDGAGSWGPSYSTYEVRPKETGTKYTDGKGTSYDGEHSHILNFGDNFISGATTLSNNSKYGKLRVDHETRPQNIALMYCIKANP